MKPINKNNLTEQLERLNDIMSRAYSCYTLWKALREAISGPDIGMEKAEKNVEIMNVYMSGHIFMTIMYSLETAFIIDLHKFFEKSKDSLRLINKEKWSLHDFDSLLSNEDKKYVKVMLSEQSFRDNFKRLSELRCNICAHESKITLINPKIIPPEIDALFEKVQDILGVLKKEVVAWEFVENDAKYGFESLIHDLEIGQNNRRNVYVKS